MAVAASAFMTGMRDITHLAVMSTKFAETPCEMCGCCRQFWFEMATKLGLELAILCFAEKSDAMHEYTLGDILPNAWSSTKW